MNRKAVSGIVLSLLLIGMLAPVSNVHLVRAEPKTWTVDDDGPADFSLIQEAIVSPLVADGDTIFVCKGTYDENVVVNKTLTLVGENGEATIDGGGTGPVVDVTVNNVTIAMFTIRNGGLGTFGAGVKLSDVKNCSISGNNITANEYGVFLDYSSDNSITDNNVTKNGDGIRLDSSSNNSLSGNCLINNDFGIMQTSSNNNNIFENYIANNMEGICLSQSSTNNITQNAVTSNMMYGILLDGSGNSISGNNITGNLDGFVLGGSDNNVTGNNITYNQYGFYLAGSDNTLRNNDMANNLYNFGVHGYELADFINDVDNSNTVEGKPVYYWVSKHSLSVPSDAGYVALVNCTDIIAEDLDLQRNSQGALLVNTHNMTITTNKINGNDDGIYIWRSSGVNITRNIITNNEAGISLVYSLNNSIAKNSMANNNPLDIRVAGSSNNAITENVLTNSGGIGLGSSSGNSIKGNNITNGGAGIFLEDSSNTNSIFGNNIADNMAGICFYHSSGNILRGNRLVGNRFSFGAVTYAFFLEDPDDFVNDVDDSNTIDDKPVCYWINRHNEMVPSDAGYVALVNCTNITVKNLDLKNNWEGILLAYTANATITQNNMTANRNGIYLAHSSGNTFSGNRIANEPTGIHIYASPNNKFYHNFIANPIQVWLLDDSTNVWDDGYPSGGNYWSNYVGVDEKKGPAQNIIGSDDIGDTPYVIDLYNQDYYPLMNPWIGRYVYVTQFNLHEGNSSNSTLLETVLVSSGTIQNATISGDFSGFMNFTSLHGFRIETGPFANQGCIRGNWTAAVEDMAFQGTWETFQFFDASRGAFTLKGAFSGDLEGIAEGSIIESVPGSGVYDQFHAFWRLSRVGSDLVSVTIELNGTLTDQDSSTLPSTELYVYQSTMNGSADGYYSGPLSAVVTHIRIEDENSPCYGEGFSTISYDSQMGSGEGWTADKCASSGIIKSTGMFQNPLSGVVSATLHSSETPTTLNGTVSRLAIDIGLSVQPELKVKVWGPQRVSPGQTIEYIIEYGNYGSKAADEAIIFAPIDPSVEYISASSGAFYNDILRTVNWNLGSVPAKTRGYLSIRVKVAWGLPDGATLESSAYITGIQQFSSSKTCLFLNGIGLRVTNPLTLIADWDYEFSRKYHEFAGKRNADWVPVYFSGEKLVDALNVLCASQGYATPWNGLLDDRVIGGHSHNTVWGYSGGTRTIVTAILQGGLKAKTVVLISPVVMTNEDLVNMHSKGVEKIIVYQSEKDHLFLWTDLGQLKIDKNDSIRDSDWLDVRDRDNVEHGGWLAYLNENEDDTKSSSTNSTITVALDPNIKYGPEGYVLSGQKLDYTIEYENEGEGIAFGVYFTDTLDEDLDDSSLEIGPVISTIDGSVIAPSGTYDHETRTITWFVGEVGPGEGGYANLSVNVRNNAPVGTEIINFATVYFPSVPETTRTNGVVSVVGHAHDVATLGVKLSEYKIERGSSVLINATVENQGVNPETFNVTAYANTTAIQTETVTLTSGNHTTVTFTWDTTGFAEGNYTITAVAGVVPGEIDEEDNKRVNGLVTVYGPLIPPPLLAIADFDPDTLNLNSQGQWITAYIELTEGHNPEGIDAATILLNETIQPVLDPKYDFVTNSSEYIVDHDGDGILERMVKFNRTQIASWIHEDLGMEHGNVTLTIAGVLYDGTPFEGSDVIRVFFSHDVR